MRGPSRLVPALLIILASGCLGTEIATGPIPGQVTFVANGSAEYGVGMRFSELREDEEDSLLDSIRCEIDARAGTEAISGRGGRRTTVNDLARFHTFVPAEGQVTVSCRWDPPGQIDRGRVEAFGAEQQMVILQGD